MNTPNSEKYEMLTSGSNWFNPRTQKLVTVLFVTNEEVNAKFAEQNPSQVVFLTATNAVISVQVEKFLSAHEFYNIQPEVETLVEKLLSGEYDLGASVNNDDRDTDTDEDDGEVPVHRASLARNVDIVFHTVEGDTRREPLLTNDYMLPLISEVKSEPIVIHRDGNLYSAGVRHSLVFMDTAPELFDLLADAFDPASSSQNYAGFTLNGETVEIDTFLGLTRSVNRAGAQIIVNVAQIDEGDEDEAQVEELEVPEEVEEPAKPKSFAELAAELHKRAEEATEVEVTEVSEGNTPPEGQPVEVVVG